MTEFKFRCKTCEDAREGKFPKALAERHEQFHRGVQHGLWLAQQDIKDVLQGADDYITQCKDDDSDFMREMIKLENHCRLGYKYVLGRDIFKDAKENEA